MLLLEADEWGELINKSFSEIRWKRRKLWIYEVAINQKENDISVTYLRGPLLFALYSLFSNLNQKCIFFSIYTKFHQTCTLIIIKKMGGPRKDTYITVLPCKYFIEETWNLKLGNIWKFIHIKFLFLFDKVICSRL